MTDLLDNRSKSPLFLFQTPPSSPPTSNSSLQTSSSISVNNNTSSCDDDEDDSNNERRRRNFINNSRSIVKWSLGTSLVLWMIYYWRKKLRASSSSPKNLIRHLFHFVVSLKQKQKRPVVVEAPYSELLAAAKNGQITKALVNAYSCIFHNSSNNLSYRVIFPFQSSAFQTELLQLLTQGGCTNISALPDSWTSSLATPAVMAMPFVYLALLYKMMTKIHSTQTNDSPSTRNNGGVCSTTTFRDVAGIDNAKLELMEVVQCLRFPKHYQSIGARPPRGVLLHGPAGTGKTLLARAVAGEANCCCFLSCSASDFVEMLVGRGAARIRALFDTAKKEALQTAARRNRQRNYTSRESLLQRAHTLWGGNTTSSNTNSDNSIILQQPSAIIFIDEIDALAKSRTGGLHGNDEREQTLNQLLTEMDGFESNNSQVTIFVLAATNRPEMLDSALLRPGRFDRHVYVGCPDARGREDILRLHAKHVKLDLYTVDLEQLASSNTTHGFTGADLRNVVNEAAFLAIRDGRENVGQHHLIQAAKKVASMKHL